MKKSKKKLMGFVCIAATASLLTVPTAAASARFVQYGNGSSQPNIDCPNTQGGFGSKWGQSNYSDSIYQIYSNIMNGKSCRPSWPDCDNQKECPYDPIIPTPDPDPTPDPSPTPDPDPTPDPSPTPDPDPTPDPNPTPDPDEGDQGDTSLLAYAKEVLKLVNRERAAAGLNPVSLSMDAQAAAQVRATEIPVSFSHTRPDGSSCFTALKEQGISYLTAGENIAWGQSSPSQVMNVWMNSSGHRANILDKSFTQLGVGVYRSSNGTLYWTQMFIS